MPLTSKAASILDKATSSVSHGTIIAALTQYEVNSRQNIIEIPLGTAPQRVIGSVTGIETIPKMEYRDVRKSEAFRNFRERLGELGYDAYTAWVKPGSNVLSVRFAGHADHPPEEVHSNVQKLHLFLKRSFASISEGDLSAVDSDIATRSISSLSIPLKASELLKIDAALGFRKVPSFSEHFIWANEGYRDMDSSVLARGNVIVNIIQSNDNKTLTALLERNTGSPRQHGWFS